MTTIAIDSNYVIASDGQSCLGSIIATKNIRKVFLVEEDWIAGAGSAVEVRNFVEWYKGDKGRKVNLGDCSIFVLVRGKILYTAEQAKNGDIYLIEQDVPYAMGTGSHVALGAMLAGKKSKEAVKIAAMVDVYTNDKVKEYNK